MKDNKIINTIAAICGMLCVFVFRRNLSAEASLVDYFGLLPETIDPNALSVVGIHTLYSIPLVGFIYFNFFDIINVFLIAVLFLPTFMRLQSRNRKIAVPGIVLLLTSFILYTVSNQAVGYWLNIDNDVELNRLIQQSSSNARLGHLAVFFLYTFGIFITVAARRVALFSIWTFRLGILANGIGILFVPLWVAGIPYYLAPIIFAAPFTVIWQFNVAMHTMKRKTNKRFERIRLRAHRSSAR